MDILKKCEFCYKRKLFIKKRTIEVAQVNKPITSEKKMCGECAKLAKLFFEHGRTDKKTERIR